MQNLFVNPFPWADLCKTYLVEAIFIRSCISEEEKNIFVFQIQSFEFRIDSSQFFKSHFGFSLEDLIGHLN